MSKPCNLIIKINYYHYRESVPDTVLHNTVTELPGGSSATGRIELPSKQAKCEYLGIERPRRLHTILEEPPQVNLSTKPTMTEMMHVMGRRLRGVYTDCVK